MNEEEANDILNAIQGEMFPPTNLNVLSKAQGLFAERGDAKPAACIAQWVVQVEGGKIDSDTFKKLCLE